jgi:NADH:ubiquinone oxidoreductase subunit 2 (subunit N)
VTIIPVLAVASIGAALAVLGRRSEPATVAVALLGLVVAAIAAAGIRAGDEITIGETMLAGSDYARLFIVLAASAGILLILGALASGSAGDLPLATLAALAVATVVLAARDPVPAAIAATAGGLFAVVVTIGPPTIRSIAVAARELRALVVAGTLVVGAIAWSGRPELVAGADPVYLGLAYLAGVAAVAIRFGSIPFHLWAARVADAAPEAALPLVMAWAPATFAVVGLGWVAGSIAPVTADLGLERAIVVLVAAATIGLASVAASIHDDLEHVVGYGTIADAGFIVLALAALDPAVLEPARVYLLVYVVAKSAFAAWAGAVRETFGIRRLTELGGWARRAPLLAIGLLTVLVATVGLPGVAVWEARAGIAGAVLDGPLDALFVVAGLAPALYVGRLFWVGFGRTSATVASGAHPWPRKPERTRPRDARGAIRWAVAAWRDNRAPNAAACALVLGVLAVTLAAGGFGLREAAGTFGALTAAGG